MKKTDTENTPPNTVFIEALVRFLSIFHTPRKEPKTPSKTSEKKSDPKGGYLRNCAI